jgi:hypothetical protein
MNSDLVIGYNRNDFFYVMAEDNNQLPAKEVCENEITPYDNEWVNKCNATNFKNNSVECIQKELCKNRDKVTILDNIQHRHTGADQRYLDVNYKYDQNYLDTINLGVGIMAVIGLIVYYK